MTEDLQSPNNPPEKIETKSIGFFIKQLTPTQLWSILGALSLLVGSSFTVGYKISNLYYQSKIQHLTEKVFETSDNVPNEYKGFWIVISEENQFDKKIIGWIQIYKKSNSTQIICNGKIWLVNKSIQKSTYIATINSKDDGVNKLGNEIFISHDIRFSESANELTNNAGVENTQGVITLPYAFSEDVVGSYSSDNFLKGNIRLIKSKSSNESSVFNEILLLVN